jgi:hypothetical protein
LSIDTVTDGAKRGTQFMFDYRDTNTRELIERLNQNLADLREDDSVDDIKVHMIFHEGAITSYFIEYIDDDPPDENEDEQK